MMALRLLMMRAGVGFPVVTVMIVSCDSGYRITIPQETVLIHGGVHVNHPPLTFI
jgi:hypothetical protein